MNKNNAFFLIIKNNIYMLNYIFRYSPGLIIYIVILKLITGLTSAIRNVYLLNFVVDAFLNHQPINNFIAFLVFYIVLNIIVLALNVIFQEMYYPKQKQILAKKMQTELFKKAISIELASYDNPTFYNDFIWAMSQSEERAIQVLNTIGEFVRQLTTVTSIFAFIMMSDAVGILFVIISCTIVLVLSFKTNIISYNQDLKVKDLQRKRDYTNRVFYQIDFAKEIRLSNVKEKLIDDFCNSNSKIIETILCYSKKLMLIDIIKHFFSKTVLLNAIYMLFVTYKAIVLKTLSYGAVIGLLKGVQNLQDSLINISELIPNFAQYSMYIDKFKHFLEYEPILKDSGLGKKIENGIGVSFELKNVSFTYKGNKEPTLRNINLHINAGEKIALVGYNGAGKSTLIKLLMRLYDVSDGTILVNEKRIDNYSLKEYRDQFGVVFQDYRLFAASLAENVAMNITDNIDGIEKALIQSGFEEKLNTLENGVLSQLTREFDNKGINLSGGEEQKIALARVFYKKCQVVILDEPSSALDPISEYEINKKMFETTIGKTVIFISHRLSTTVMADRIIMLEGGQIVEEGSHKDLMYRNGKYAEMFRLQSQNYNN